MPISNPPINPQDNYDPRWFVWTIVFLMVTGISLVSYIMMSDSYATDTAGIRASKSAARLK